MFSGTRDRPGSSGEMRRRPAVTPDDPCASDFSEFFTALWDKCPFCWQKDLAKRVLERETASAALPGAGISSGAGGATPSPWPEAIALPTASGKIACMDVALFALAVQASRLETGQPITAPRRIFFVVDRRVIVDEAYERARRLAGDDSHRVAHGAAARCALAELDAPSADAPVMLPAHVDCWAQTTPEPRPSPDVAHFLHGPRESVPDVQACWRADSTWPARTPRTSCCAGSTGAIRWDFWPPSGRCTFSTMRARVGPPRMAERPR